MKITAHRKVYWDVNGREVEGKVKQMLTTHAIVAANGCEYIVLVKALRTTPREAKS